MPSIQAAFRGLNLNLNLFRFSRKIIPSCRCFGKMAQIIECVPNFSEGRNQETIDAISSSIKAIPEVTLLDVDAGQATNRTVYTFVGNQKSVVEAALAAARTAFKLIDMTTHFGEHPRLGALDVCPFIPVSNASMDDCVACARKFSEKLTEELNIPVYLYGFAAQKGEHRKSVPQIRAGEYEGLAEKTRKPEWQPDFGPAQFVPKWGATIVGARKFLIAYNINLLSTKQQAHRIALNIREQGRGPQELGRLKQVQAIGWWYVENRVAQISTNLTDVEVTTLHEVFVEAVKDAAELNLPVIGSEIVGLVPLKPMLDAAEYFLKKEGLFVVEEEQKIQLAINRLGLNMLSPFNYKTRIIEYAVQSSTSNPLLNLPVKEFIAEVAARKAAPGGGSVAACVGSMGAGLCRMVALLSYGNKKFEQNEQVMRQVIPVFHAAMGEMQLLIDLDTQAFNAIIEANRLPTNSPEEVAQKSVAVERATRQAIDIPMRTGEAANGMWTSIKQMAQVANMTCISDLQVGAKCLETAVHGAMWNVQINLTGWTNHVEKEELLSKSRAIFAESSRELAEVVRIIDHRQSSA